VAEVKRLTDGGADMAIEALAHARHRTRPRIAQETHLGGIARKELAA